MLTQINELGFPSLRTENTHFLLLEMKTTILPQEKTAYFNFSIWLLKLSIYYSRALTFTITNDKIEIE